MGHKHHRTQNRKREVSYAATLALDFFPFFFLFFFLFAFLCSFKMVQLELSSESSVSEPHDTKLRQFLQQQANVELAEVQTKSINEWIKLSYEYLRDVSRKYTFSVCAWNQLLTYFHHVVWWGCAKGLPGDSLHQISGSVQVRCLRRAKHETHPYSLSNSLAASALPQNLLHPYTGTSKVLWYDKHRANSRRLAQKSKVLDIECT